MRPHQGDLITKQRSAMNDEHRVVISTMQQGSTHVIYSILDSGKLLFRLKLEG